MKPTLKNLDSLCRLLAVDPLARGLQLVAARELARDYFPRLDTDRPALIFGLSSNSLARRVRATLLVNYPKTHPVVIVRNRAVNRLTLESLPLGGKSWTTTTVLYVAPLAHPSSPLTLADLMTHLRAPDGCPWDRQQTHKSLRRALIEESYEVIDAINANDMAQLKEELGDLFLHVLFQTEMAQEQGAFTLAGVGEELAAKLIRRHPHVFGKTQVRDADQVLENWERIKREEKNARGEKSDDRSLDADLPRDLPALARAQKIHDRARRRNIKVGDKPHAVVARALARARDRERALGQLLFALAGFASEHHIDAESALREAALRATKQERDRR